MNKWGIPGWLEQEVRDRDRTCVYCGVEMLELVQAGGSRKTLATWEHIINDAKIVTRDNIARCRASCNSSKGAKKLSIWLQSRYCEKRAISWNSVAEIVKRALEAS